MAVNPELLDIVKKVRAGDSLRAGDIRNLLEVDPHSLDAGFVMGAADELNRAASDGLAEVHAQIGLNLSPCPRNCSFCAFAAKNGVFKEKSELSVEDVINMGRRAEEQGANALFIMATGDYPLGRFIELSLELRAALSPETVLIANVGDFGHGEAKKLKDVGFSGIYHAVRMGEGEATSIKPETRMRTVQAAIEAGLMVGTCVEPIGPEHSVDELVEKILIGREMKPRFSGAMRRISIPGTEMAAHGMISEYRMAYVVAVVRLAMGIEVVGNCTHEPNLLGAASGANLFWAEVGSNPRDTEAETSDSRGLDIAACRALFTEAEYELVAGPSRIYR